MPFIIRFVSLLALAAIAPSTSVASVQEEAEWLQVIDDREREEVVFLVGPIELPADAGHDAVKQPPLLTATVPVGAFLYGFDVQMLDGDGRAITNRVLHHVNLIDPDHRELFSPVSRRLFAAGGETGSAAMPRILGVPLEKGQRLLISAMFHNPTAEDYPRAQLKVTLKYRQEGWIFPVAVYPVYIDVMGHVGEKDFDLPPGRSEVHWEGSPAVDGRLLAASGHLHDRASELRFEDMTEGKVLWRTAPVVDERGRVVAVPVDKFWWKGGISLKSDHVYRLTVVYENPESEPIARGGMGVLGGVFLPARGVGWPELDPENPIYLAELAATRATAERRAVGMAMGHGAQHKHHH